MRCACFVLILSANTSSHGQRRGERAADFLLVFAAVCRSAPTTTRLGIKFRFCLATHYNGPVDGPCSGTDGPLSRLGLFFSLSMHRQMHRACLSIYPLDRWWIPTSIRDLWLRCIKPQRQSELAVLRRG